MQTFQITPAVTSPTKPLAQLATSPQRVRTDEGTVEERPIEDILKADVYNRLDQPMNPVSDGTLFGIGIVSVRPPDTLGTQNRFPWPYAPRYF